MIFNLNISREKNYKIRNCFRVPLCQGTNQDMFYDEKTCDQNQSRDTGPLRNA